MPHAALWVVQPAQSKYVVWENQRFNAARGYSLSPPPPLRGPPPPLAQGRLGYAPFSRRITQYQLPPPMRGKWRAQRADRGAHAARGFVGDVAHYGDTGGAAYASFNAARGCFLSPPPPLRGPPPPLAQGRLGYAPFSRRITQYQLPPSLWGKWRAQRADRGAHAARGFVGGATKFSRR